MPGAGYSPAQDFDADMPSGSTVGYDADNDIRDNQAHVDNAYAVEHYAPSDDPDASEDDFGRHDFITLKEQAAKPSLAGSTNRHAFYAKSDGVYIEKDDATESKLFDLTNNAHATAPGFHDGTQAIAFPTNGMAAAKFMLGNSSTIVWFYLNAAPPGWKVLTTGAGEMLAISGGAQAYNANGGTSAGSWTQPNHTLSTSEIPSHSHVTYRNSAQASVAFISGVNTLSGTAGSDTDSTGGGGAHNHGNTYRPLARIGKLFQLDTA